MKKEKKGKKSKSKKQQKNKTKQKKGEGKQIWQAENKHDLSLKIGFFCFVCLFFDCLFFVCLFVCFSWLTCVSAGFPSPHNVCITINSTLRWTSMSGTALPNWLTLEFDGFICKFINQHYENNTIRCWNMTWTPKSAVQERVKR